MPTIQQRDNIRPMHRVRAGQPPPCAFPDEPFSRATAAREAAHDARQQRDAVRAELAGHTPAAYTTAPVLPRRRRPIARALGWLLLAGVLFVGLGLPLLAVLTGGQP